MSNQPTFLGYPIVCNNYGTCRGHPWCSAWRGNNSGYAVRATVIPKTIAEKEGARLRQRARRAGLGMTRDEYVKSVRRWDHDPVYQ